MHATKDLLFGISFFFFFYYLFFFILFFIIIFFFDLVDLLGQLYILSFK